MLNMCVTGPYLLIYTGATDRLKGFSWRVSR